MNAPTHAIEVPEGAELACDVCIVGSGAGGSVLAAELAAAGADVIVIESGGHYVRNDFLPLREDWAYSTLYQDRGTRSTADHAVTIMQGHSVGGGTTVNWTTCYRTPQRVLDLWRDRHGVDTLTTEALSPHWDAVEARLNIGPWSDQLVNRNNDVLRRACTALGWEYGILKRNVKGCANSGFCGLGCPVDGKQGMAVTYLRDALASGARVLHHAVARRLNHDRGVASTLEVTARGPSREPDSDRLTNHHFRVRAKTFVVAGGAINSPALLLRSGLDASGQVGKRTWLHPVVAVTGRYEQRIDGFYGAPQTVASHQFIDRGPSKVGFFLEVPPMQPMLASIGMPDFGERKLAFMQQLPYISGMLGLMVDGLLDDEVGGTVRITADGSPKLDYPVPPQVAEAMGEAHLRMVEAHLAAGAVEVSTGHRRPITARSADDLPAIRQAAYGAHEHPIFTAHQMGGCTAGADPARSAVDNKLRLRGTDNVFVVDGSVLPTALGVNPSQTIYGIARWAAGHVRP